MQWGRYVRVQLSDTDYLHMAEVKVYGRSNVPTPTNTPTVTNTPVISSTPTLAPTATVPGAATQPPRPRKRRRSWRAPITTMTAMATW
jgi:hypothetical protein